MDIEDKLYWLNQIRTELLDLQENFEHVGDIESADDYEDMIDTIDEVIEDLHRLEDLLT